MNFFSPTGDLYSYVPKTPSDLSWAAPVVIGIVLIAIIIYVIYVYLQPRPASSLVGPVDLYSPGNAVIVDRPTTSSLLRGSYTLAFYVFINAVPDSGITSTPMLTCPGVWDLGYNAPQEQLIWRIGGTVALPNVPAQRWTQVVLTVEGRTVDMLVNGALIKTHTMNNVAAIAASSISIVPGNIYGRIAIVQTWPRRLPMCEVASNYASTSDSQGRPYFGPDFINVFNGMSAPNTFCPTGNCGTAPVAPPTMVWEFPYA
uniref:Lectin/glucanase superfamily protein n=1 Tax=viral metagenome TaxID=1070528 RepID=A0A6C0E6D3_9ZZZZ